MTLIAHAVEGPVTHLQAAGERHRTLPSTVQARSILAAHRLKSRLRKLARQSDVSD